MLSLFIYTYLYVTISKLLIVLVGKILGGGGNCPHPVSTAMFTSSIHLHNIVSYVDNLSLSLSLQIHAFMYPCIHVFCVCTHAYIILCSSVCVVVYVRVRVFLIVDVCMLKPYGLLHSQSYAILQKSGALHISHNFIYMCTQFITKLFHNH